MNIFLSLLLSAACISATMAVVNPSAQEGRIINECLKSYGGLTEEKAQRLVRFREWSEKYEEIPCFTKCYLKNMLDIFDEAVGFKEEKVINLFGQSLYNACQHRMVPLADSCEQAYHGFHCIVNLEDDPFVLIESKQNISAEGKTAMKDCLGRSPQLQWKKFKEYTKNPVREPIRCFTKCVIDHLQVFNAETLEWNISALRSKLGVPRVGAKIQHCLANRRTRDSCVRIYQVLTCLSLAH